MAVPKCCIAAKLSHVFPNSMAMLCLQPAAGGDDPHKDRTVPILCMRSQKYQCRLVGGVVCISILLQPLCQSLHISATS